MIFTTHPDRPAYDLPAPVVAIGDKIAPFKVEGYARRKIVRALISSSVETLKSLRRKGHVERTPGDAAILTKHTKSQIRDVLTVIDTAYEVEVIGIVAHGGGLTNGHVANQCYVDDTTHWCQLIWRAKVGKNHVATVQETESVMFCFSDRLMAARVLDVMASSAA